MLGKKSFIFIVSGFILASLIAATPLITSNHTEGKQTSSSMTGKEKNTSKKIKSRKDCEEILSGDEVSWSTDAIIGKETILKKYYFNLKKDQIFSITWDPRKKDASGNIEVGLIDEDGNKIRRKIGAVSNTNKRIIIPEDGTYYFYFCSKEDKKNSRGDDTSVDFYLVFN